MSITEFELQLMREAKAHRDAHPEECVDPAFERELDRALEEAEAKAAAGRVRHESPVVDPVRPSRPSSPSGASNHNGGGNAPSEKQLWLIGEMVKQRGLDIADFQPKHKKTASEMIDRLFTIPRTDGGRGSQPTQTQARPATERQVEYVTDLAGNRDLSRLDLPIHELEDIPALTAAAASSWIEVLSALPRLPRNRQCGQHGIRTGRYAFQPVEGPAQFYIVDRNGKLWVQAGPARHPYNGQLNEALLWIRENPRDAAALYGQLVGSCGRCGMALTDEDSRARGLGPHCANKSEW